MTPRAYSVCRRVLPVALAGAALAAFSSAFAAPSVPGLEVSGLSTMIMSLALVIGFIFAAAFVAKRMPFGLGARGNNGALVASVMVGHDGHRGWVYYLAVHPGEQGHGDGSSCNDGE